MFLQLKHSASLSPESLKAIYMSNMNFFKLYSKFYGMSGTIGGVIERQFLHRTYDANFFQIPRFGHYRYEYNEDAELVAANLDQWKDAVIANIEDTNNTAVEKEITSTDQSGTLIAKAKEDLSASLRQLKDFECGHSELVRQKSLAECAITVLDELKACHKAVVNLCHAGDHEQFSDLKASVEKWLDTSPLQGVASCASVLGMSEQEVEWGMRDLLPVDDVTSGNSSGSGSGSGGEQNSWWKVDTPVHMSISILFCNEGKDGWDMKTRLQEMNDFFFSMKVARCKVQCEKLVQQRTSEMLLKEDQIELVRREVVEQEDNVVYCCRMGSTDASEGHASEPKRAVLIICENIISLEILQTDGNREVDQRLCRGRVFSVHLRPGLPWV